VDNVFLIKNIYDQIGQGRVMGIASPYLNFRDALFHYKKMYESMLSGDMKDFWQQLPCIEEHLNRGVKDFAINLCSNFFIKVIHSMMLSRARCITDKVFQRLRHIYHELKNIVAEIRLGGQTLLHFDSSEVDWLSRMIEIIKDFNDLIDENSQLKNLYDSTIEGFSS
jgi:hypothetical protein